MRDSYNDTEAGRGAVSERQRDRDRDRDRADRDRHRDQREREREATRERETETERDRDRERDRERQRETERDRERWIMRGVTESQSSRLVCDSLPLSLVVSLTRVLTRSLLSLTHFSCSLCPLFPSSYSVFFSLSLVLTLTHSRSYSLAAGCK